MFAFVHYDQTMKHRPHIFLFLTLALLSPAILWCQERRFDGPLPKVHIIATGGTIAGTSNAIGYDAGKVSIETILKAVPELKRYAELDYEQFCNIGSQDMSEGIWLPLAKRVNQVLESGDYDAVLITHGTDNQGKKQEAGLWKKFPAGSLNHRDKLSVLEFYDVIVEAPPSVIVITPGENALGLSSGPYITLQFSVPVIAH